MVKSFFSLSLVLLTLGKCNDYAGCIIPGHMYLYPINKSNGIAVYVADFVQGDNPVLCTSDKTIGRQNLKLVSQ